MALMGWWMGLGFEGWLEHIVYLMSVKQEMGCGDQGREEHKGY
jgi:hypothetical protein